MEEKGKKGRMDYTLLLIVVLLVVIGLVILYSTSAYNGQVKFHDSFYYLKKQAFATVLGIVLMLFVAGMDYHIWQRLAVFGYLAAVALSVAVMLFGREINGSKRWLAVGPFFSAIRICESCTDSFSGGSCDEERKNNRKNVDTLQDHVLDPSNRGTCGSE